MLDPSNNQSKKAGPPGLDRSMLLPAKTGRDIPKSGANGTTRYARSPIPTSSANTKFIPMNPPVPLKRKSINGTNSNIKIINSTNSIKKHGPEKVMATSKVP